MTKQRTIFALSSGKGRAGIAVIRISGDRAGAVLDQMAAPRPKARMAGLRRIRHPETGQLLDEALVLWFPGPRSETGEDMAELHVHGGGAVVRAVLAALAGLSGCRAAEPGEFARRAFENGKLDLTAVEGLADLVDAETEAQRRLALSQAGGALSRLYDGWREQILVARALVEAAIDFSDESDVADDAMARGRSAAGILAAEIAAHLADGNRGEIIRDGYHVVLTGPPNVGKSSLLNALARRDVAIVSAEAGTTRDIIEVKLDVGGYAVALTDTAGIRAADSAVEKEGIRRTLARARDADLVIWMIDASDPSWELPTVLARQDRPTLKVINKIDMAPQWAKSAATGDAIGVSAHTGAGLSELTGRIGDLLAERVGEIAAPTLTQERHRRAVEDAHRALSLFLAGPIDAAELRAEDLRIAADHLARVVGRIDVEDVLGQIFARFCIGK